MSLYTWEVKKKGPRITFLTDILTTKLKEITNTAVILTHILCIFFLFYVNINILNLKTAHCKITCIL